MKRRYLIVGLIAVMCLITGCGRGQGDGTITITNVSYDPTREFYEKYNELFEQYYLDTYGEKVNVIQSHGGSGSQARSVVEGCNADVVTLALEHDIDLIANTGLIDDGWVRGCHYARSEKQWWSVLEFSGGIQLCKRELPG